MQKVRFLVPFMIFFVLFLITSGFCYYFFNEKQQIMDQIQHTQDMIGTKFPVLSADAVEDDSDLAMVEDLSIKSVLYQRTVSMRKRIESFQNKVDIGSDVATIPSKITGEGEAGTSVSRSNVSDKMKTNPPKLVDYKKEVEAMRDWLVAHQEYMKKFNNIKSQDFVDYAQLNGLTVQNQIEKATALIESLKNPDVAAAVDAFTAFFAESQEIDKDSPRWKEIDAVNSYVTDPAYKSAVLSLVSDIETAVKDYSDAVNKAGLKYGDMIESRKIIFGAYSKCRELVEKLTFYNATIDGEEKRLVIPKISDSKAKNEASELLIFLHPNDNAFVKRIYSEGSITPSTTLPTDEFGVANLEFEALVADSLAAINSRRFRTNPAYLAGIDLETILEAQNLTIDNLVEMNKMLKARLIQVYGTRESGVAKPSVPMVMKAAATTDIEKNATDLTLDIQARIKALESRTKNSDNKRDELLKVQSGIAELADALREEYEKLDVPLQKAKAEHEARLASLEKQFIALKKRVGDDIRSEGKLRPSQGADGVITFTDKLNDKYNINLGKADKIVPGMRFLVYSEGQGGINAKGIIEVLNLRQNHYANCSVVIKYPGTEILKGDKISNPFFRKVNGQAQFLSVAFIGKFEPPESNVSNAQMKVYLEELGVKVMDEPDSSTDLIILAKPISKLVIRTATEQNYRDELRPKVRFDEIEIKDILIYFQDQ